MKPIIRIHDLLTEVELKELNNNGVICQVKSYNWKASVQGSNKIQLNFLYNYGGKPVEVIPCKIFKNNKEGRFECKGYARGVYDLIRLLNKANMFDLIMETKTKF